MLRASHSLNGGKEARSQSRSALRTPSCSSTTSKEVCIPAGIVAAPATPRSRERRTTPVGDRQLLHQPCAVSLDRLLRQRQPSGDLGAGAALGKELQHLALARRKPRQ